MLPCSDSDQYISTLTHSLAYELWKELEGSVGELDGASFRCGLNACVVVGRIDEANSLLTFMLKHKISPGLGSYNILIKFYCGAGRVYVWQGCGREYTAALDVGKRLHGKGEVEGGQDLMSREGLSRQRLGGACCPALVGQVVLRLGARNA